MVVRMFLVGEVLTTVERKFSSLTTNPSKAESVVIAKYPDLTVELYDCPNSGKPH